MGNLIVYEVCWTIPGVEGRMAKFFKNKKKATQYLNSLKNAARVLLEHEVF